MAIDMGQKSMAQIAVEGPITGPVLVREAEVLWDEDGGSHRPKGREHKYFGFFDRDRGIALRADLGITKSTRYTPRHKHDCESVRYIIRGKVKYGHEVCGPGDCVYNPESVPYGPEDASVDEERVQLGLQYSGPSGIPYLHPADQKRARKELAKIGKFEKGIYIGPDGRKQDGAEAFREYLRGKELTYAPPRYNEHIVMRSENYTWKPLEGAPGVWVKHLGYFNETGPNIKLVKIDAGASTQAGVAPCQQVRYVFDGAVSYKGESYGSVSCMYFPAHVPYSGTASRTGATLFVIQLASPDGQHVPPYCLI